MTSTPRAEPEIVFVTGPPRSGTTMLAAILSQPPALPYLPECSVITDIVRERVRSGREQHPLKFAAFYGDAMRADRLYQRLIEEVLRGLLPVDRVISHLVLKDPYLLFWLAELGPLIPWNFKTLCIVRDPKDVVASFRCVRSREGKTLTINAAINFILPFFQAAVAAAEDADLAHRTLFIRYEDVVRQKPRSMAKLSRFLGYAPAIDKHEGVPREQMDLTSPWHTPLYEQPVVQNRIGAYRQTLSVREANEVMGEFKPWTDRLSPLLRAARERAKPR